MEIPKNESEIIEFMEKEHEKTLLLHENLNKEYISFISDNISQRRDFFKNLVPLCGIILGFMPFLFEKGNIQQKNLFFLSMFLFLLVIILIINYLRSILDVEGNELVKQLKEYNNILNPLIKKRREFFIKGDFTTDALKNLISETLQLQKSSVELLKNRDSQSLVLRKKDRMDYTGEFLLLLFELGIIFLTLSLTTIKFNLFFWCIFFVIIISFNFFVPFHKIFVYIGIPIEFIKDCFKKKNK